MFGQRRPRQTLGEGVCYIFRSSALEELDMPISYEISQIVHPSIDVTRPLPIRRILTHYDSGSLVHPYLAHCLDGHPAH